LILMEWGYTTISIFEKLEEKLRQKPIPNDISILDIKTILEGYGFICSIGGKNHLKCFHSLIEQVIIIPPPHNTSSGVKRPYIKMVIAVLNEVKQITKVN